MVEVLVIEVHMNEVGPQPPNSTSLSACIKLPSTVSSSTANNEVTPPKSEGLEEQVVIQELYVGEEDDDDEEDEDDVGEVEIQHSHQKGHVDAEDGVDDEHNLDVKVKEHGSRQLVVVEVLVSPGCSSLSAHTPNSSPLSARCRLVVATTCCSVRSRGGGFGVRLLDRLGNPDELDDDTSGSSGGSDSGSARSGASSADTSAP